MASKLKKCFREILKNMKDTEFLLDFGLSQKEADEINYKIAKKRAKARCGRGK